MHIIQPGRQCPGRVLFVRGTVAPVQRHSSTWDDSTIQPGRDSYRGPVAYLLSSFSNSTNLDTTEEIASMELPFRTAVVFVSLDVCTTVSLSPCWSYEAWSHTVRCVRPDAKRMVWGLGEPQQDASGNPKDIPMPCLPTLSEIAGNVLYILQRCIYLVEMLNCI